MPFAELSIVRPTNGQVFVQSAQSSLAVEFEGSEPSEINRTPLFFRWYSSLNTAADARVHRYSVNEAALTSPSEVYSYSNIPMGSHVIAFAASDQPSEANILNSVYGGATGGANKDGNGYLIHVLKANILSPDDGATVSTGFEFKAEAPWAWKDLDYQKYNGLRYRWKFDPLPANRPTLDFPSPDMTFHDANATKNTPAMLVFKPVFPPTAIGAYKVTLYVQGMVDSQVKGEATDRREISI